MLRKLLDFLEELAPGCVASSTSERISMGPWVRAQPIIRPGYREIRTVYFNAAISDEQKERVIRCKALTSVQGGARSHWRRALQSWPAKPTEPESVERGWLRGVRGYQGQLAVAVRFFFEWTHPEFHRRWLAEGRVEGRRVAEQFEEDLMAAGMIGSESVHVNFDSICGRWIYS